MFSSCRRPAKAKHFLLLPQSQVIGSILYSLYRTIKSGVTADKRSNSSITVNYVLDALKDIKLGKHDGKYSLTSDHVVNSSNRFLVILSILMSSMLVHGTMPRIYCRLLLSQFLKMLVET